MQIPGQNAEAPFRRQISRRENAMKLCLRTISVNDEKRFSGLADRRTSRGWYGAPRRRRSGSHPIYARKHRVYERRHPLAAPTCERRVIALRGAGRFRNGVAAPGGPPMRQSLGLVMVVSHLFNFRAVHHPGSGPLPAHWILRSRDALRAVQPQAQATRVVRAVARWSRIPYSASRVSYSPRG